MFSAFKEFLLYLKYRKIVKQESLTDPIWIRKNLRLDWLCRIYTVINLPPEVTMSRDLPMESRPSFVFDTIKPINDYLRKTGIEEMISLSIDPLPGTDNGSYLVVYYFLFKKFNLFYFLFYFLILPTSIVYLALHFIL